MTPVELSAYLDGAVYGDRRASGVTDGIPWDVRTHPRTESWRVSVVLPWRECPDRIGDRFDSQASSQEHVIVGMFALNPDPAWVVDFARSLRIAGGAK